jgi:hypothetical protein
VTGRPGRASPRADGGTGSGGLSEKKQLIC